MDSKELINELGSKVVDLIEEFNGKLPAYEIVHQLIANASSMCMACAPNHALAFKTILASVENGIGNYQKSIEND
jgi:hypothetical protein